MTYLTQTIIFVNLFRVCVKSLLVGTGNREWSLDQLPPIIPYSLVHSQGDDGGRGKSRDNEVKLLNNQKP